MRFKAKLLPEQVSWLHSALHPLSRLAGGKGDGDASLWPSPGDSPEAAPAAHSRGAALLCLDERLVRLAVHEHSGKSGGGHSSWDPSVACYAEFAADQLFGEHRIESAAGHSSRTTTTTRPSTEKDAAEGEEEEDPSMSMTPPPNVIVLQLDLVQWRLALQSLLQTSSSSSSSHSLHLHQKKGRKRKQQHLWETTDTTTTRRWTTMKLARRQGRPCLCLESTTSVSGAATAIHHALPVRVLRPSAWTQVLPPALTLGSISLVPVVQVEWPGSWPAGALLGRLAERGRALGPVATLTGHHPTGQVTWTLETTHGASLHTLLTGPSRSSSSSSSSSTTTTTMSSTVQVDTHKFYAAWHWTSQVRASRVVLCWMAPPEAEEEAREDPDQDEAHCRRSNEPRAAHLFLVHVELSPSALGTLTYYVPVHHVPPDDLL